jgi:iron complex outermembrane recepter protein
MKYRIISLLLLTFNSVAAQITGRLIDASTDMPVVHALIISGKSKSFSGDDGTFSAGPSGYIFVYADGYQMISIKQDTLNTLRSGIVIKLHPLSYNLSEVNVTAFHNPEKLRSVAGAVTVIPVDSLKYAGYNIVSSFAASPGLNIQEATPGTMKLTLRGIGSRYPYGTKKIKMFFDDIPLYSAEGETYFDDINPEFLSRIEILRGPASSIWGASLGGAVIMYPKIADYGHSEMSFISSAGSWGYLKNTLTYSNNSGRDNLNIAYSGIRSDGYRENSSYLRHSLMLSFSHRFGERVNGSLLVSASLVRAGLPSSVDSATLVDNPQAAAPQWLKTKGKKSPERILLGYKLNYQLSDYWDIRGSVFGTFRQNEENRPFNFLDESGISYGGRVLARYARNKGRLTYKITSGSNLFFELYENSIHENPGGAGVKGELSQKGKESLYQADLFTQFDLTVSDFTFSGGFNLNKSGFLFKDQFSSDSVDQSGSRSFEPVLSPRISISWQPLKTINTYIAINNGFTIPSLSETMTPLGLVNNNIKPEKAWSYEAGARFVLFVERSFIDVALYYMKVSDLIVPKRVAEDFYIGMNAGASLHKGIEFSLQEWLWGKQNTGEPATSSVILNLSYTLNSFRFLEFNDGVNDFAGNKLPGIPEHNFSGSINLKTKTGFYSELELLSSARIPLDDFNSGYADSWVILNAKAGYSLRLKRNWGVDAMFALNNVTDARYVSMVVVNAPGTETRPPRYYYPGMPLNFTITAGLSYRFLKN